ncbi:MAG TPA: hypothetical protein ENK75_06830, partial [Saprospiraceae bacterium]|nr:hypothetical protein [Saprospiraceae bacterium]
MKARISYYTTILLVMSIFSTAFGQFAVRSQFEDQQSGYWILGLNGGFSYQSSDVDATSDGWGFGATLGKNVYYKKGAPLSFDLRGRLLLAQQYGLDATRSYDITNNEAVNGSDDADYINYPSGLGVDKGFVYHNHKTTVGEAALEGVFTLNQLQERTGIVASIYGGIGLDVHATQTDQLNSQGEEYYPEYANLSEDQKAAAIRKELKSAILDNNYESFADGYENGVKLTFMPSLGVELGYQLTPRFSVHAGHRFTFTRDNIIDGEQWKDDQNDLYHYTNFALRWKVTPHHLRPKAPEITIYNPTGTPHSYSEDRFTVRAR